MSVQPMFSNTRQCNGKNLISKRERETFAEIHFGRSALQEAHSEM